MELQELQDRIHNWSKGLSGSTLEGKLEHLKEEVEDLQRNPYDINSLADVYILLLCVTKDVDFNIAEIQEAIKAKQAINESRDWGTPDERGIIRHLGRTKI